MLDKFIQGLRLTDEDEDVEYIQETSAESIPRESLYNEGRRMIVEGNRMKGKLTSISNANIIIMKPKKLNEAKDIIDKLAEGNTVAVDLDNAPENEKQRIMDMLAGYCYCTQSNIESINKGIYIISHTPIELDEKGKQQ